jgi:2',3'-cyclic-nucleotide 2'-phosphodiesterase (5'-nucleotidase family)
MIRRNFLKNVAALGATLTLPSFKTGRDIEEREFIHSSSELDTAILMHDLAEPFTILHIADSHVSMVGDETEEPYVTWSRTMREINLPGTHKHFKTGAIVSPMDCLEMTLELAKERKPDLLVLGGDIINYPSELLVKTVMNLLNQTGIPWIYTAGNHDWYYPDEPGEKEELRKKWIEKRLLPLYQGTNPMCHSLIWKDINIVAIDNSTNTINEEQLNFYKKQMDKPHPIALFTHIPLRMPGMMMRRKNNTVENPPVRKEDPSSVKFRELVMQTSQLAGIFAGHTHENLVTIVKGKVQYVTSQGADGRYRFIHFGKIE